MTSLAAVILAKDEAANIVRAIESLRGISPILVLDAGSRDGTPDIARRLGAEVVTTDWPGFAQQRRRAMQWVRTEWMLFLDADEALDENLNRRLVEFQPAEGIDGYYLRRRNYFLGRPIEHGRWSRDWQLRLFRVARAAVAESLVHEGIMISGATERLDEGCLEHYTAPHLEHYWDKLLRYSALEADQKLQQGRRAWPAKMIYDLISEFWKDYFLHQGWREGWRGFALAHLQAFYKFVVDAQLWERGRGR